MLSLVRQKRRYYSTAVHGQDAPVLIENKGETKKVVILNRPKVLNALDLPMVRMMTPAFREWSKNPKNLVILKGAGEKRFCAGGDVKAIWEGGKNGKFGRGNMTADFFYEEYQLNYLIALRSFTQVSFWNGVTMGGGVGVSVHGKFRVATENTVFAMPESAIGFFPDVGGSLFLSRLDLKYGSLGKYLGLTGAQLRGKDTVSGGVATHYISSEKLPTVESELLALENTSEENVKAVLDKFAEEVPKFPEPLVVAQHQIEDVFSKSTLEEMVSKLESYSSNSNEQVASFAQKTLLTLNKMSPTSLKVINKQLMHAIGLGPHEVFQMEYRMSQNFMRQNDFFEGVRAALVDKDKNPQWKPKSLAEISEDSVEQYFKPPTPDFVDWIPDSQVSKL